MTFGMLAKTRRPDSDLEVAGVPKGPIHLFPEEGCSKACPYGQKETDEENLRNIGFKGFLRNPCRIDDPELFPLLATFQVFRPLGFLGFLQKVRYRPPGYSDSLLSDPRWPVP